MVWRKCKLSCFQVLTTECDHRDTYGIVDVYACRDSKDCLTIHPEKYFIHVNYESTVSMPVKDGLPKFKIRIFPLVLRSAFIVGGSFLQARSCWLLAQAGIARHRTSNVRTARIFGPFGIGKPDVMKWSVEMG